MKPIFQYTCHRRFIKDRCKTDKKRLPFFTNKYITNKLGQKSTEAFYRILNGTVKISDSAIIKIIEVFKLNSLEACYFAALVHLNQAETMLEKVYNINKILNFVKQNPPLFSYDQCQFFIKNHYLPLWITLSKSQVSIHYNDLKTYLITPLDVSEIKKCFLAVPQQNVKKDTANNDTKSMLLEELAENIFSGKKIPVTGTL